MLIRTLITLFIVAFFCKSFSQVQAFAGNSKVICYNTSTSLGGNPSALGGATPYTYSWEPSTFLNSATVANPIATGVTSNTTYTLTVTDKNNVTATNEISISLNQIYTFSAGDNKGYCYGQQFGTQLGALNNTNVLHNFSWSPSLGLDNSSSPRPYASPAITTVYQLTVSDGVCPNVVSQVTVTPFPSPTVDAGQDTTIDEGMTITLNAIGDGKVYWQPDYNIKYANSKTPDVWPVVSIGYTVTLVNVNGCYASDTVRVTIRNGDKLFFYSAFTPNKDGDNDVFFVGNAEKYPDNNLKVYNRYGKIIYSATSYVNTWDGSYFGNEVPTGTYFYIFFDGIDKTYKGSVTIMR